MNSLPKPTKRKKPVYKTASEKRHMDAVAKLGCIVYGHRIVRVHHCDTGMGRKKNHFMTIPLHPALHTKEEREAYAREQDFYVYTGYAIHENKTWFECNLYTETELLCRTYEKLDAIGKLEDGAREIWESIK